LAVWAKSKPGRITGLFVMPAGVEQEGVLMIGIESPELVKPTVVFLVFVILLDPHFAVGGLEDGVIGVQRETGRGTLCESRCCRDAKQQQHQCSQYSPIQHICIQDFRLVAELVLQVRTTWMHQPKWTK
jgi:hypothetical protein